MKEYAVYAGSKFDATFALAESLRADILPIDERAADRGLIDFALAIKKLEQTTFGRPEALLRVLLKKHKRRPKHRAAIRKGPPLVNDKAAHPAAMDGMLWL